MKQRYQTSTKFSTKHRDGAVIKRPIRPDFSRFWANVSPYHCDGFEWNLTTGGSNTPRCSYLLTRFAMKSPSDDTKFTWGSGIEKRNERKVKQTWKKGKNETQEFHMQIEMQLCTFKRSGNKKGWYKRKNLALQNCRTCLIQKMQNIAAKINRSSFTLHVASSKLFKFLVWLLKRFLARNQAKAKQNTSTQKNNYEVEAIDESMTPKTCYIPLPTSVLK